MAPQLPWELEEEILSRLPPQSLSLFRIVCKRWNGLFKDKTFQNNHFHLSCSRPQFILMISSKSYSVDIINPNSVDPKIKLRDLPSSPMPHRDFHRKTITTCDELLFCYELYWPWKVLLSNPWLRQVKKIPRKVEFRFLGLGYDNSRSEKVYKILCYSSCRAAIYDCASQAFKFIDTPVKNLYISETDIRKSVSLNGNLYWFEYNRDIREHFIQIFDFSMENFKPFCLLPCQTNSRSDVLLLAVFKRDGFSLLKQCYFTKKIEVWVTNKIDKEEVVWMKLMTLPTTNLRLFDHYNSISYFIHDKTLFVSCGYDTAYIYIVRGDMCNIFQIQYGSGKCCHCVYTPNLISVPYLRG